MCSTDGSVKLSDFGYSVLLHLLYEQIRPTGSKNPSHFWIAPENLKGC